VYRYDLTVLLDQCGIHNDAEVPLDFFNDTATTEIYTTLHTLSLHDALPI
jgi:hypothetical protein